jgi:hypothetical protein
LNIAIPRELVWRIDLLTYTDCLDTLTVAQRLGEFQQLA